MQIRQKFWLLTSWTDSMCRSKFDWVSNVSLQVLHFNVFTECKDSKCLFNWIFFGNFLSQLLHWYIWSKVVCLLRHFNTSKVWPHIRHWNGFFSSWKTTVDCKGSNSEFANFKSSWLIDSLWEIICSSSGLISMLKNRGRYFL